MITLRFIALFAAPVFIAYVLGSFAAGAAYWTDCLAPGVEACAEGQP